MLSKRSFILSEDTRVLVGREEPNEPIRIWLCECGRIHAETRVCRVSLEPAEFVNRLREAISTVH